MLLEIDDGKTISDLQERFTECFPSLKIEFFQKPHHWSEKSPPALQVNPSQKIGAIRKKHDPGIMEIKSWDKTGEIEREFRKLFGLNVQVYYLINNNWIQTTASDDLTLGLLSQLSAQPQAGK